MKKILIITELFPNQDCPHLGTFVMNQLNYLKKFFNITVIVPRYCGFKIFCKKQFDIDNIKVYYFREPIIILSILRRIFGIKKNKIFYWNKYFINQQIFKIAKKLNQKNGGFDLIIGHESGVGDEACSVAEKLKIPSIFHLHGLFDYHGKAFGKAMKKIVNNINKSNQIISVSNIAINSYLKNGLKNQKIITMPNVLAQPQNNNYYNLKYKKIIKNKKIILSVGWLVEEKRIDQVIRLAYKIKDRSDVLIIIIGEGEKHKEYISLIKSYNLENKVYLIGAVDPAKMSFFYKHCSFLLHPSIIESFSMVCLEAMSHKKPIICTKNAGISEYITDGQECFIIDPDNEKQIRDKSLLLLDNRQLRKAMGNKAFIKSQNFTDQKIGEKIKKVYDNFTISKFK